MSLQSAHTASPRTFGGSSGLGHPSPTPGEPLAFNPQAPLNNPEHLCVLGDLCGPPCPLRRRCWRQGPRLAAPSRMPPFLVNQMYSFPLVGTVNPWLGSQDYEVLQFSLKLGSCWRLMGSAKSAPPVSRALASWPRPMGLEIISSLVCFPFARVTCIRSLGLWFDELYVTFLFKVSILWESRDFA